MWFLETNILMTQDISTDALVIDFFLPLVSNHSG